MSKYNEQKSEYHLVYKSFLDLISKVRQYGIKKHGSSFDWRTTPNIMHYDAALRHIFAIFENEEYDKDSNLPHLAHAASNLMFLIEEQYGNNTELKDNKMIDLLLNKNKNDKIINH